MGPFRLSAFKNAAVLPSLLCSLAVMDASAQAPGLQDVRLANQYVTDFGCTESIAGDGFRGCEAEVGVTIESSSDVDVHFACDGEVEYQVDGGTGMPRTERASNAGSAIVTHGHGHATTVLEFNFSTTVGSSVVQADFASVDCFVTDAFSY